MKRREFCRMSVAAGAATMLPAGRLLSAPGDSSAGSDLRAVKLSGAETTIERAAVQDLRASLSGTLLVPGDEGYETSRRVWNGMIDKHPALIARCTNTADVVRAVTFARERELLLAVRGGGHSFPGYSTCDGGLVIDLSPMRIVEVHSDTRTVRAARGGVGSPRRRCSSKIRSGDYCRTDLQYRRSGADAWWWIWLAITAFWSRL